MKRHILITELVLIAAALVAAVVAYPHLPSQIVTHWGTHLEADGYSSRSAIFLLGPGLMSAVLLLTRLGPWLSPARYNVASFYPTWQQLMFLIFCLLTGMFSIILWSALGHVFDTARALMGAVCLFLIFFGNLLSKVRPNFFLGIRTPWTLASERVWIATHRLAAWLTVLSGILGLLFVLVGKPDWAMLPFLAALAVAGGYSLMLHKQTPAQDLQTLP